MASDKKVKPMAGLAPVELQQPAFLGVKDGVTVIQMDDGNYAVAFDYDRQLAALMRSVPGAQYNKDDDLYKVPTSSVADLGKAAESMRIGHSFIVESLLDIKTRASGSGHDAQRNNGAAVGVLAKISDFIEPGRFYAGEIVNANAHFAAQLTGFGQADGAAFIAIHRLANLDNVKIMKGDHFGIKYDGKFRGVVSDLSKSKSADELEAEFKANQGKTIDGVALTDRQDKIGVAFDLNPVLLARIKRVDGAQFNKEDKVWEIPREKMPFVLRAVHDMRAEFVLDAKEVVTMQAIAESKIDGAKMSKAYTKDDQEHFGKVLAVGDRFALQKAGQDKFTLHYLAALSQKPVVDQNLAIKYSKGVGAVIDQEQKRAQDKALGAGR